MEEQHRKLDPACVLLFTESRIHYPVEDFEDLNYEERMSNTAMVLKSRESLDIDLATRLSGSVTDITLSPMIRSSRLHIQRDCWIH